VMLFNTGREYDFLPKLSIDGESFLEVVEQFKLLGVIVRSDLRWHDNTDYICTRGYERIWMIRRLKSLGAGLDDMIEVYNRQVRSVLELSVPVWQSNLTKQEESQIERVQKTAFHVIMGSEYQQYNSALELLGAERLSERRIQICINFAKKAMKHQQYKNWFAASPIQEPDSAKPRTRAPQPKQLKCKPVPARTGRYYDSPIPYLSRLLNEI
jgi:hypothetical protein